MRSTTSGSYATKFLEKEVTKIRSQSDEESRMYKLSSLIYALSLKDTNTFYFIQKTLKCGCPSCHSHTKTKSLESGTPFGEELTDQQCAMSCSAYILNRGSGAGRGHVHWRLLITTTNIWRKPRVACR